MGGKKKPYNFILKVLNASLAFFSLVVLFLKWLYQGKETHAVKNESVSLGAISRGGAQLLLPTMEANGGGLAMRKSQDCPRSFPHHTVAGGPRGSGWAGRGPVRSTAHHQKVPGGVKLRRSPLAEHHCFPYFGKSRRMGKLLPTCPSCPAATCPQEHLGGSALKQVSHSPSGTVPLPP